MTRLRDPDAKSTSDQECDGSEAEWVDFQRQQTRTCTVGTLRADGIAFLLVTCELVFLLTADGVVLHRVRDKAIGFIMLACIIVMLCVLAYVRRIAIQSPNGVLAERCCIAHNGLQITSLFAMLGWRIVHIPNEIMMHKVYLSAFVLLLIGSTDHYYVPVRWHLVFVSVPAGMSWLSFHWAVDFLTPTTASWAVLWPCIGLFFFRHVEAREWARFQSVRRNEQMRALSEGRQVALRNILISVFDATCECSDSGKVLSASPHFQDLIGSLDESILGCNLSDLALDSSETARIASFLEHVSAQSCQIEGVFPAAKLETSLRHRASGNIVRVSLYCVSLPSHRDRIAEASRLFMGWQRKQFADDAASSNDDDDDACCVDWSVGEEVPVVEVPNRVAFDKTYEKDARAEWNDVVDFGTMLSTKLKLDFETSSSLAFSLTNTNSSSGKLSFERLFASTQTASTQTDAVLNFTSALGLIEKSTQTASQAGTTRPPRPENKCPGRVSFRSSHRFHRRFKATPEQTIQVCLRDVIERINPSGHSCCGWHLSLASVGFVLKSLQCTQCESLELPDSAWQCHMCSGINYAGPDGEEDGCNTCGGPASDCSEGDDCPSD